MRPPEYHSDQMYKHKSLNSPNALVSQIPQISGRYLKLAELRLRISFLEVKGSV